MNRLTAAIAALLAAGNGRLLPALLLALSGLLLYHSEQTPLSTLQQAQFDRYQRLLPRVRNDEPVIVVGIDSQSLVAHGQWPWPRQLLGELLAKIQRGQPLAVGLDFLFAERDQYAPALLAERLPALPTGSLAQLPDPDTGFAAVIARSPVVLATAGLTRELPGARLPMHPLPYLRMPPGAETGLPHFPSALSSRPELQAAASGEGFINTALDSEVASERGILRRVPTLAMIENQPYLSLPLEMLRQALGGGEVALESSNRGMNAIRIGDYRLPTQADGSVLLHFGRASSHYYLSAADVLAGIHPDEIFNQRFVIIGFNSIGLQDRVITPLGDSLPGADIHAQMIESLLSGEALRRPAWMPQLELGALLLGGLFLIGAVPALRPRLATLTFSALGLSLLAAGHLAFLTGRWLFDGSTVTLLLAPVFIALLGNTLIAADRRRRRAEEALQASREAAARVAGELDAARQIQMGLLPDPVTRFAGETRFAVGALLEPALAVGGDYYDCFMLDAQRLCIAIGDVAGKGVPASLFMAISKTLGNALTRRHADLATAVRDLEAELDRNNPACLFVTAFIAILDVDRGELEYICAGHDAPILKRNDRILRLPVEEIAGPPLCALGDYPFATGHFRLAAGDLLCLFTDGASEAECEGVAFGRQGIEEALRTLPEATPDAMCRQLCRQIRAFENGAAPADDLTLLLLRWQGPSLSGC